MSETSIWDIATVIGTVGAVVVAVASLWIPRLPWFRPKLAISLNDDIGTRQSVFHEPLAQAISEPDGEARYFHIKVENKHRHAKATRVHVVVTRLEIVTSTGQQRGFIDLPSGVPLVWQHEHTMGAERILGPDAYADLFSLVRDPANH